MRWCSPRNTRNTRKVKTHGQTDSRGGNLQNSRCVFRRVSRERLRVSRSGLSRMPRNRIRVAGHPSEEFGSVNADLQKPATEKAICGRLHLLRQGLVGIEGGVSANRRTSRTGSELSPCHRTQGRLARQLWAFSESRT